MGYAADRASQIGRRAEPRFPTRIASVISSGDRQSFAIIEDISERGAKVSSEYLGKLDDRVTLRGISLDSAGRIVWRTDKKCGVQFDERIAPLEVIRRNAQLQKNEQQAARMRVTQSSNGEADS